MTSSLRRISLAAAALAVVPLASATPTLYYSTAETTNGFGTAAGHSLTSTITTAFGAGNVYEVTDFSNAATFADASAIVINARGQNPAALSAAEKTNILNFINEGGATFFIGDHGSWQTWDDSFLGMFGDAFTTWTSPVGSATSTGALASFFPPMTLQLSGPGAITGGNGTSLFTLFPGGGGQTVAAVYGPKSNAIAFLDTNALGNSNNSDLFGGLSSWLFTTASAYEQAKRSPSTGGTGPAPVPDAGSVLSLPLALALLWGASRRGRKVGAR